MQNNTFKLKKLGNNVFLPFLIFICTATIYAQEDKHLKQHIDSLIETSKNTFSTEPKKTIEMLTTVVAYASQEKDSVLLSKAYNLLGLTYTSLTDRKKSFEYYFKAKSYANEKKDLIETATIKNNIGLLFKSFKLDNYALKYYNEAENHITEANIDSLYESRLYSYIILNKSIITRDGNTPEVAVTSLEKLIGLLENSKNITEEEKEYRIRLAKNEKAAALFESGKTKEALKLAENQSDFFKSVGSKFPLTLNYLYLGQIHNKLDHQKEALYYGTSAHELAIEFNDSDVLRFTHNLLSNIYEKDNKYEEALKHTKSSDSINEKIYSQQEIWSLYESDFQLNYLKEQKNKELLKKEEDLTSTKTLLYAIICIATIIAFSIILYFQKRKHKKEREYRLQIQAVTEEQLKKTREILELKKRKLTTAALQIVESGGKLQLFKDELNSLKKNIESKYHSQIDKLGASIDVKNQQNWEEFKSRFEQVNKEFFINIKEKHPNLTPNDLKLCSFLKLNFNSKDIANLMNISAESVKVNRYRLRKKMQLNKGENLVSYIDQF